MSMMIERKKNWWLLENIVGCLMVVLLVDLGNWICMSVMLVVVVNLRVMIVRFMLCRCSVGSLMRMLMSLVVMLFRSSYMRNLLGVCIMLSSEMIYVLMVVKVSWYRVIIFVELVMMLRLRIVIVVVMVLMVRNMKYFGSVELRMVLILIFVRVMVNG